MFNLIFPDLVLTEINCHKYVSTHCVSYQVICLVITSEFAVFYSLSKNKCYFFYLWMFLIIGSLCFCILFILFEISNAIFSNASIIREHSSLDVKEWHTVRGNDGAWHVQCKCPPLSLLSRFILFIPTFLSPFLSTF